MTDLQIMLLILQRTEGLNYLVLKLQQGGFLETRKENRVGHHIDAEGRFQSDKFPELPPDKVVISLKDPKTWAGLRIIAVQYQDDESAEDFDALRGACVPRRLQRCRNLSCEQLRGRAGGSPSGI